MGANTESYSAAISAPGTTMEMAGIRVYDWDGEAKLTFGDGTFENSTIAGPDGKARLDLQAKPSIIAYTRPYQNVDSIVSNILHGIIPAAYAETPAETACATAMTPIPPDAEDINIRRAEQYMNVLLECFVKKKVEEARLQVETSHGVYDKGVAIIRQATMEGLYEVLKAQKNTAVVVANCLDAVVTGNNSSAVGAGCDFVTSMLAIGDIRDLLIQSWNYCFDEEAFDGLTASLSAVGLVASVAELAGGSSAPAAALAASGKTIAKFLKRIGEVGKSTGKVVGSEIGKIARDDALTIGQKLDKFKALVPVFEITASVTLMYQDNPRMFQLLAHMMKTPDKFKRFTGWMQDYLARLSAELDVVAYAIPSKRSWLDYFINSANASLSKTVDKTFKEGMAVILKRVEGRDIDAVAMSFDEALEEFLRLYKDLGPDGLNAELRAVTEDTTVIKALMNIGEVAGGVDSMRRFAQNGGWTLGMKKAFSVEGMVSAVADMRIDRISGVYEDSIKNGLKRVLSQVDHRWGYDITKGDMSHFLTVVDLLASGKVVKGVEVTEKGVKLENGFMLAERRIDIIVESDGLDLLWDIKANLPDRWETNLVDDMSMSVRKKVDGRLSEEVPGQMLTDLGKLYRDLKDGSPTNFRQRVYTPEVLGLQDKPSAEAIAKMEKAMNDKVVEMIDSAKYEDRMLDILNIDKKKYYRGDKIEENKFAKAINDLKKMVKGEYDGCEKCKGLKVMIIYPFDGVVPPVG